MARVRFNLLLFFTVNILSAECFKILGICSTPYRSHYNFCKKILTGLANRGHEITMVTFIPLPSPVDNITEILLDQNGEQPHSVTGKEYISFSLGNYLSATKYRSDIGLSVSKSILENFKFKAFLQTKQEFDLVMIHMFHCEALLGVINHFKCPLIPFISHSKSGVIDISTGNVAPLAYSPAQLTKYSQHMSFFERLANVGYNFLYNIYFYYVHLPQQYEIYKKHFPDEMHLENLMYNNISLFFINSNPVTRGAIPVVPTVVGIAGIHIEEPDALPQDLQDIMDNASNGVIYFSLGSVVSGSDLPSHVGNAMLKSFSKRSEIILWRTEKYNIHNIPHNVIVKKWFPQISVLAHPNLKAFISHGGANSIIEAVYFGVPVLDIPLISDQLFNIAVAQDKGFGIYLDLPHITEDVFSSSLKNIIEDTKYKEIAKIHSKALRDQLVNPMDTVVFWTEHVVRNNGARHLRSPAMDLHWTQIYLLDIGAFVCIMAFLFYFSIKFLILKCHSLKNVSTKIKNE